MIDAFYKWAMERIDRKILCESNIHDIPSKRCYPTIHYKECVACFKGDRNVAD